MILFRFHFQIFESMNLLNYSANTIKKLKIMNKITEGNRIWKAFLIPKTGLILILNPHLIKL